MNQEADVRQAVNIADALFTTHKLNDKGFAEMQKFKCEFANAVRAALSLMPEGREKALFKTKIEEAVFFGAKAIAGSTGNSDEIVGY